MKQSDNFNETVALPFDPVTCVTHSIFLGSSMLLSSKLKFSYSYPLALTLLFSFTANAQSNNCTNIGNIIAEEPFVLSINNATLNQCATVNTKTAKAFVNSLRTHNLE